MTDLSIFLRVIWLASGVLQLTILVLILWRRHYRTLPAFACYIGLNLAQAIVLVPIYSHYGFLSTIAYQTYWVTEVITMIAQMLASTTLLHRALEDYPGIWELSWRVIWVAIVIVIAYSWATANSKDKWGLMYAHRGFYLIFAVAFVACLLLIRHYSIPIDPVYRVLIGGFCLYACGNFVADTLLKTQFVEDFPKYSDVWNGSDLLIFFAVLVVWVVALRHPVRASAKTPGTRGVAYEEFSPQLNARLRELNDTLRRFFRRQAAQP